MHEAKRTNELHTRFLHSTFNSLQQNAYPGFSLMMMQSQQMMVIVSQIVQLVQIAAASLSFSISDRLLSSLRLSFELLINFT